MADEEVRNERGDASVASCVARPERRSGAVPRGRALLVLEQHGQPSELLHGAWALARSLGLELHVLRVLRQRVLSKWLQGLHIGGRLASVRRSLRVSRADRRWCDLVLGAAVNAPVHVRVGDFLGQAARFAEHHDVSLVMVPPREGRLGARVISLAGCARQPVLVLRGTGTFRSLVAATDLEDDEYPVLRKAVELGGYLDASVVAVHNVSPIACVLPLEAAFATTMVIGADTVKLRQERLRYASAGLRPGIQAVVAHRADTVGTIVGQVRASEADLVLVGTRTKPWLDRLIVKSVAAEVVDRSPSSVLVTPIRQRPWFDGVAQRREKRRHGVAPSTGTGSEP